MSRALILLLFFAGLAGCTQVPFLIPAPEPVASAPEPTTPQARPTAIVRTPPPTARTAEEFDTTTDEERAEAAAAPATGDRALGTTVASLGDPVRPGFWMETPLVSAPAKGRVVLNGRSAQVDLLPSGGPVTGGSRLSLAAMRLLEAPLTGLPTVEVFSDG